MKTDNIKFLVENPSIAKDITLQINGAALLQFADKLADATALKVEQRIKAENKSDELLTREQVKEILNVSHTTLYHWNNKGILSAIKIGNKVRYRRSDIEKLIAKNNPKNDL